MAPPASADLYAAPPLPVAEPWAMAEVELELPLLALPPHAAVAAAVHSSTAAHAIFCRGPT